MIIRGIRHAITCLTPSPKKQKKEKNDSEDMKVNLPRNDALIADAADEPRFAKKTENDVPDLSSAERYFEMHFVDKHRIRHYADSPPARGLLLSTSNHYPLRPSAAFLQREAGLMRH
ncbi:hypothetical protein ALC53_12300 [Atta colombica]|uniref:Uncharacterized protein n=1 Tax=Atta colombica TaxID=520822 RepID=A0A195AZD4_9HYME|nr:hypothetical protein ALC53_12300 [Atta colombica]